MSDRLFFLPYPGSGIADLTVPANATDEQIAAAVEMWAHESFPPREVYVMSLGDPRLVRFEELLADHVDLETFHAVRTPEGWR